MFSLNYSRQGAEWERRRARWWRGGERATGPETDMMERQTGREKEKWERQNGVYSSKMSELVCRMKKQKKIKQFPQCWHTRTNTLHGALQSALCMKHSVTYVASVLSAASVTGAQMAVAIFSTAPPSSLLMGDVVCDDVLLTAWAICQHMTACFQIPLLSHKSGSNHMGVGRGAAMVMGRMDICTVYMKRSGLGTYCGNNITETLEQQRRLNPRIVNKALSDCRRKLSVQTPKPLPPFPLPHTHSRLALTHCVSSSNSLHSLLP